MGMQLDDVVPWGRSFDEYVAMFALSEDDLEARILACADGPAAFNAGMRTRGRKVVSVDPLYAHSPEAIRRRIETAYRTILQQVREHRDDYVWDTIRSPDELGRVRMTAMVTFLGDFTQGAREGPHVARVRVALAERGYAVSVESVPYTFVAGADEMMVVGKKR